MALYQGDKESRTISRPWQSFTEYQVDEALAVKDIPADQIRKRTPPPQQLFPERRGFGTEPWTIQGVMNLDRYVMPSRRSWISGMPAQRSYLAEGGAEGTSRNSMSTMWGA